MTSWRKLSTESNYLELRRSAQDLEVLVKRETEINKIEGETTGKVPP